jgi:hypothetical protein
MSGQANSGTGKTNWRVTQGGQQFSVPNLAELRKMAAQGRIQQVDMIQPPGASDWLYASEIPELKESFRRAAPLIDDSPASSGRKVPTLAIAVVLLIVAGISATAFYRLYTQMADADMELLGGEGGMALTEMLVTANPANLLSEPKAGAASAGTAPKDSKIQLLAKRGGFYEVQAAQGAKGWVAVDAVIPAYFFADSTTREDYDPIYNPDRYVFVKNSSWLQLPDQKRENITVFSFVLQNKAKFEMTDIILKATIMEKNDRVLEEKEFQVEGDIPPFDNVMVGTLSPDKKDKAGLPRLMTQTAFAKEALLDPKLNERWTDGVEVKMVSEGFVEASIDIVQIRAVPKQLKK